MDQSLIREDVVRLQSQTGELIARFDRVLGLLKALLIALIGVGITAVVSAVWNASRVVHAVEDHGRRIEKLEDADEGRVKLQHSLDRIERTLDSRLPATGK